MEPGTEQQHPPFSTVVEDIAKHAIKLGLLAWLFAWVLSSRWLLRQLDIQPRNPSGLAIQRACQGQSEKEQNATPQPSSADITSIHSAHGASLQATIGSADVKAPDRDAWRQKVGSKVVEFAWEKLSNSIVQQWVYDTWYCVLTPDREFPAEVRRLVNAAFGEVCQRARSMDVKGLLIRDLCEILVDNIELYRYTRKAVGHEQLRALTPAARERALQREMRAMGNLHTALCTPTGHYRVLRSLSDALLTQALATEPVLRTPFRAAFREMCATCLLRPIMMYFLPCNLNRVFLMLFPDGATLSLTRSASLARALVEGSQELDARAQRSVAAESSTLQELAKQSHRRARQTKDVNRGSKPVKNGYKAAAGDAKHGTAMGGHTHHHIKVAGSRHRHSRSMDDTHTLYQALQNPELDGLLEHSTAAGAAAGSGADAAAAGAAAAHGGRHQGAGSHHGAGKQAHAASKSPGHEKRNSMPGILSDLDRFLAEHGHGAHHHHLSRAGALASARPASVTGLLGSGAGTPARGMPPLSRPPSAPEMAATASGLATATPSRSNSSIADAHASADDANPHERSSHLSSRLSAHSAQGHQAPGYTAAIAAALADHASEPTTAPSSPHHSRSSSAASASLQHLQQPSPRDTSAATTAQHAQQALPGAARRSGALAQVPESSSLSQSDAAAAAAGGAGLRAGAYSPPGGRSSGGASATLGRSGFVGWPRASVVAPEIHSEGFKDYVAYKIRVADDSGEWTVTRRYRNFEALHSRMRERCHRYRDLGIALPPKRIFMLNHDAKFVNKRRLELDTYVNEILSFLPACLSGLKQEDMSCLEDVWQFLNPHSELFSHDADMPRSATKDDRQDDGRGRSMLGKVGDQIEDRLGSFMRGIGNLGRTGPAGPGDLSMGFADDMPRSSMDGTSPPKPKQTLQGPPPQAWEQQQQQEAGEPGLPLPSLPPAGAAHPPGSVHEGYSSAPEGRPTAASRDEGNASGSAMTGSAVLPSGEKSSLPLPRGTSEVPVGSSAIDLSDMQDLADSIGTSTPLYDLMDAVFNLQARGFFRRQVATMARQMLSLLAGDAIDKYVMRQLAHITSEHFIARMVLNLQSALWPGGVWYAWANQQQQQAAAAATAAVATAAAAAAAGKQPGSTASKPPPAPQQQQQQVPRWQPPPGMQAERYLEPAVRPPDEEVTAERVRAKLLSFKPTALVRLLGQRSYTESLQDVYDMLQSQTFTLQIGYGALEATLLALFPELKPLISKLRKEALQHQ